MRVLPPVVMLITASVAAWMRGTNWSKTSGSGEGRPSLGSRACRCRIAAPALAASIACVAISSGVTGSASDMVGVWIEPVIAQVMITLLDFCAMGAGFLRVILVGYFGLPRAPQDQRGRRAVQGETTASRTAPRSSPKFPWGQTA